MPICINIAIIIPGYCPSALKKLSRILKGDRLLQRNWEVQFLHPKGRKGWRTGCSRPGLNYSFVDRQRLTAFLADFHPPGCRQRLRSFNALNPLRLAGAMAKPLRVLFVGYGQHGTTFLSRLITVY